MKQTRKYFYAPFNEEKWKDFPPDKWDYGDNNHETCYKFIKEATEGDIILCSYKQEIIAIGEVYDFDEAHDDHEKYTYFNVITKPEKIKPFSLKYIKNKTTIEIGSHGKHFELKIGQIKVAQWIQQCYEQGREMPFEINREDDMSHSDTNPKIPLNQILYGPPGTGKTYRTIDEALKILREHGEIDNTAKTRLEKKKIFDKFKRLGQIQFITFHQSYSYEEFVEGIKPIISNDEQINNKNNEMTYERYSGIFKKICERAKNNFDISKQEIESMQQDISIDYNKTLWRLYTIPDGTPKSDFFEECIEKEQVWVYKQDSKGKIEDNKIKGDYLIIPTASKGMSQTIRAFGVFGDFIEEKDEKLYRKVKWLWKDTSQEGVLIPEANFGRRTFQRVNKAKGEVLQSIERILKPETEKLKPYILIIDEINRGNISKILGELITLIEPSKRIGATEELRVTLPYSQELFGVPKNLYIIGTMNTADRSIALLDTALRRRFEFIEMMPDCEELKKIWLIKAGYAERDNTHHLSKKELYLDDYKADKSEILCNILEAMNRRIEFLLDREHTIGHVFFFERAKYYKNNRVDWYELNVEDLKNIFAKKVIPLLQEYFYDDYAKIDSVLNGNGMIKVQKVKVSSLFSNKDKDLDLEDKNIYKITDSKNWNEKDFQKIYDDTIKLDNES